MVVFFHFYILCLYYYYISIDYFLFLGIKNKVFEQLDAFAGIPFTVQRLAELLTSPRRHYKRTDKFMRALEKNMLIVSTVEARATSNNNASESRYAYVFFYSFYQIFELHEISYLFRKLTWTCSSITSISQVKSSPQNFGNKNCYEPIWFDLIWTYLIQFKPIWSDLIWFK